MQAYFDNCATTKVSENVISKMNFMMKENYANPASLHSFATKALSELENSREAIAQKIGSQKSEIIFTSGGTEGNNLALLGAANALKRRGNRIVTTAVEHPSVGNTLNFLETQGFEVVKIPVGRNGAVSEADIFSAVNGDTVLVSIMLVNNETGSVFPVAAAKHAIIKANAPAVLHCDAVQAFGKVPVNVKKLRADLLTLSAHKIHGPKGIGALYKAKNVKLSKIVFGGGQEEGIRSGTLATELIAGFCEAVKEMDVLKTAEEISKLNSHLLKCLEDVPFEINSPANAVPHIVNLSFLGTKSEVMLHYLSSCGFYVSSGSACSKGKKSVVLSEMGLSNERIDSALRISFSKYNTIEEVEAFADAIKNGLRSLLKNR